MELSIFYLKGTFKALEIEILVSLTRVGASFLP
jgi:hypothetical protein